MMFKELKGKKAAPLTDNIPIMKINTKKSTKTLVLESGEFISNFPFLRKWVLRT
jgi:hypothetical protein